MSLPFPAVLRAPRLRRVALMLGVLVVTWVALMPFVPIGHILGRPLQARFAPVALGQEEKITGIIALGGDPQRVVEAVKLAHRFPRAKLVITGAPPSEYKFAAAQGFAPGRLMLEMRARNTFENATLTKAVVNPRPEERWLLVTSAWHMPRAVGCFRKAGFSVLPWPVSERRPEKGFSARVALREWLGLLAYWVTGRTDAPFPGPE
jgi:uncharacterized SAM-binding protein YcdF (DUF218 family)